LDGARGDLDPFHVGYFLFFLFFDRFWGDGAERLGAWRLGPLAGPPFGAPPLAGALVALPLPELPLPAVPLAEPALLPPLAPPERLPDFVMSTLPLPLPDPFAAEASRSGSWISPPKRPLRPSGTVSERSGVVSM